MVSEIIHKCFSKNNELTKVGSQINIKNIDQLDDVIKGRIIEHKQEILLALERDEQAIKEGLMVGISGTLYTWTVSLASTLYMEQINNTWYAWRETHQKGRLVAVSIKSISNGKPFSVALTEAKKYMDYVSKFRRARN